MTGFGFFGGVVGVLFISAVFSYSALLVVSVISIILSANSSRGPRTKRFSSIAKAVSVIAAFLTLPLNIALGLPVKIRIITAAIVLGLAALNFRTATKLGRPKNRDSAD